MTPSANSAITPVRLGVLGFAHGHVGMYCKQWAAHPQWGVSATAGWDHDADRLAKAVADHGVTAAASVDALLGMVDAVVIGAETSMHADLVEHAAAAGRPIVLQKPLALTMAEADRIVAAVQCHGVPFTLAWQMRVDPQNVQMKQLSADGVVGRVLMVRRRHGLSTHVWGDWFTRSWHVKPELNRGMWADDASHAIDFLLWLLGKPATVSAEIDTLLDPRVPDDQGIAIFRYPDGTIAEVVSSFTCVAGENTTEIVGDRGVIIQNHGDAPSCNAPRLPGGVGLKWFVHGDKQWRLSDLATPDNHGQRINDLAQPVAQFLRGEREAIATAVEGRDALQMTLACYRSASEGRRVKVRDVL